MRQLDSNLLFTVQAQTTAAVAQPTFVTDIDFSNISQTSTPTPTASTSPTASASPTASPTATPSTQVNCISLRSNQLSVADGAQFEIKVGINSGNTKLKSYTVKLQFNSSMLQVVDADDLTSGTQATFTDTTFTAVTNSVQNNTGFIILKAESATAKTLVADVATIKFTTLAEGTAQVNVVQTESSLVDETSANILQCSSTLTIGVGTTNSNVSQIEDQPLPANTISGLPKSDLPFAGIVYILLGVIFIYLGTLGRRFAKQKK